MTAAFVCGIMIGRSAMVERRALDPKAEGPSPSARAEGNRMIEVDENLLKKIQEDIEIGNIRGIMIHSQTLVNTYLPPVVYERIEVLPCKRCGSKVGETRFRLQNGCKIKVIHCSGCHKDRTAFG